MAKIEQPTVICKREFSLSGSVVFSLIQQAVFLTLGMMMLDGGQTFQIVGYAAIAYWVGFVIILLRRRHHLTDADKVLIRWGYMMLWIISAVVTGLIWSLREF